MDTKKPKHHKKTINHLNGVFIVYISCGIISTALIVLSFFVKNSMWSTLWSSIGCSGITATLMAVFIEVAQSHERAERKKQLRKLFFSSLDIEVQHLLERVIWFDNVIDSIDLEKEENYYLSLNFVEEAHKLNCYEQLTRSETKDRIQKIIQKCEKKSAEGLYLTKEIKMFNLIGKASKKIQLEVERIKESTFSLVESGIVEQKQIGELIICIDNFAEFMAVNDSNFDTSLKFLIDGYEKLNTLCEYDNTVFVCWHTPEDTVDMVLNERKSKKSM